MFLNSDLYLFKYNKDFMHSKTLVYDGLISSVGTANLNNLSFNLNSEVTTVVCDKKIAGQLTDQFNIDIGSSEQIDLEM